jgi:hypothetical protein
MCWSTSLGSKADTGGDGLYEGVEQAVLSCLVIWALGRVVAVEVFVLLLEALLAAVQTCQQVVA